MEKLKKVATVTSSKRLSWIQNSETAKFKKQFKRHPKQFTQKTVQGKTYLYLIEIDIKRLKKSLTAALKISGSVYALVLLITNGEKGKIFNQHHYNISNTSFKKRGKEYISIFEKIIKTFGIYVADINSEDKIIWCKKNNFFDIKHVRAKYAKSPSNFYVINSKLFFLSKVKHIIENMYYECVEIAGDDNALSKALSSNSKEAHTHLMNFRRLGFKQDRTFYLYANLFSKYLEGNKEIKVENHV